VNQPPFVQYGIAQSNTTTLTIPWSYPLQFPVGLNTTWVPVISTLNARISFNKTGGSFAIPLITNGTNLTNFINNNGTPRVNQIVLSKLGATGSNITNNTYSYSNTNLAGITSGSIDVWYANANSAQAANISTTLLPLFVTSGNPSDPTNLSYTPTATGASVTFTVTYADITNQGSSLQIKSYTVTYSAPASTQRYGTPLADSGNTQTVDGPYNQPLNNTVYTLPNVPRPALLFPDCSYNFQIYATNSDDFNGAVSALTVRTNPLAIPPTPSISFTSRYYTAGTIYAVGQTTPIAKLINSSTDWAASLTLPIHKQDNRGTIGGNAILMSATIFVINTDATKNKTGPTLQFAGFPATQPTAATATNNLSLTSVTPTDYYASVAAQSGFYLTAQVTCTIQSAFFTTPANASQNEYTFDLSYNQAGTLTTLPGFTFYLDTILTTAPTGVSATFNFNDASNNVLTIPRRVSGIYIIYGSPVFTVTTTAGNMGNYFYRQNLLNYSLGSGTSFNLTNESGISKITNGLNGAKTQITGPLTITNPQVISGSLASQYSDRIRLDISANNVFGTTTTTATRPTTATAFIPCIVDGPSYQLIYVTLPQTLVTVSNTDTLVTGFRVTSASDLSGSTNVFVPPFATYTTAYNNTDSITGNQELQVSNGKFTTPGPTYAYANYATYYYDSANLNTLNYTSIVTSGYRYATFVWTLGVSQAYGGLSFSIYDINGIIISPTTNLAVTSTGATPIQLFYRIEDTASTTPNGTAVLTSGWINGNSKTGTTVTSGNYFNPVVNGISVYYGTPTAGLKTASINGATLTFNVTIPAEINTPATVGKFNIYCRIGLPMNVGSVSFSYVQAKLNQIGYT